MNIYFSGIGGVGLGPLAQMAVDAGHIVSGSDMSDGLTVQELIKRGVQVYVGEQTGEYLRKVHAESPLDWLVYTAGLPHDHPELVTARELGIRITKRDGLLAKLIEDSGQKLIAVAGTHGKTTTTGMFVWVFRELGIPVSYSVGSQLGFGPSGRFDPNAEYFVYECDEFDRNFLKFHPTLSVITSVDYDHPDTYPTEASYFEAFGEFFQQSESVILWHDDDKKIDHPSLEGQIDVLFKPFPILQSLPGEHNRRNASLVMKAIERLSGETKDIESERLANILAAFPGTIRRFERLGDNLYSDYGHHPTEIAATLQMARELSDHVVLVYQPHQNVRQHEIRDQYTDTIFRDADDIYWLPTYLSREDPNLEVLTPAQLTANLAPDTLHLAEFDDRLWTEITRHRDAGHLVLCMGAGSIDGWLRKNEAIKKVANVLILDTHNNLILQQRDDKPGINNPGMITAFGGAAEPGETVRQAAARELQEETNLSAEEAELEFFTNVYQPTVNDGQPRWVSYFVLHVRNTNTLEVYEGRGYYTLASTTRLSEVNLSSTVKEAIERLRS